MQKIQKMMAAILCCMMTTAMLTACSDNDDYLAPGVDGKIVGNWYSDVSGKTYASWNYGDTWQNTEFKADGTGSTRIYYTSEGNAIGCEEIDFSYTASADGKLTMTPKDREVMNAQWQVVGDELKLNNGDDIISGSQRPWLGEAAPQPEGYCYVFLGCQHETQLNSS